MARLASGLVVSALLHRCNLDAVGAYVLRRGDDIAGAIRVIEAAPGARARVWAQEYDLDTDARVWRVIDDSLEAPARAQAEATRDPDLWIVEIEGDPGPYLT